MGGETEKSKDDERVDAPDCELDYKFLAESIPEILWSSHPDGAAHYHNAQWHDYTGLTAAQTRKGRWHQIVHDDDLPECLKRWEHSLRTGDPMDLELRFKRADGEHCWHLCRARAQRDAEGKVVRWIGLCTNLDEQKKSERALRQAAKLESIGVLAGGVAHDFNNLLTGILGNISLVVDLLPAGHEFSEPLEAALRESNRAADLVKQLLAYAGKGHTKIEAIQLSRLILEMNSLFRSLIPKSVNFEHHLEEQLPTFDGDRVQLQQVLMNLVLNGYEAIPMGSSGTIRIATQTQCFARRFLGTHFETAPIGPGEYVMLEVKDSGSGMDSETLARIFDPFFTTKFTGRGLGLAATLGIVKGHKGGIAVQSVPGQGTAFQIFFPVSGHADATPRMSFENAPSLGTGLVLVVDHNEAVRNLVERVLVSYGYEVLVAEDGNQAVAAFLQYAPKICVVLLDVGMPNMSGIEALRKLQAARPDVRVIISSGNEPAETERWFEGQTVAAFLPKPYTGRELASMVHLVITKQ